MNVRVQVTAVSNDTILLYTVDYIHSVCYWKLKKCLNIVSWSTFSLVETTQAGLRTLNEKFEFSGAGLVQLLYRK